MNPAPAAVMRVNHEDLEKVLWKIHIKIDMLLKCSDTGCFFNWYPPKSSKYKKVNLG